MIRGLDGTALHWEWRHPKLVVFPLDEKRLDAIRSDLVKFIAEQLNHGCKHGANKTHQLTHLAFFLANMQPNAFLEVAQDHGWWRPQVQGIESQLDQLISLGHNAQAKTLHPIQMALDAAAKVHELGTEMQAA
ncbi:uncharacterized protein F5Z01DRAFT_632540 [Emericellopsis atlantica]|uniref:Uncharacterized protein n=1 Tax=Emericellopsis atlantica TaxID=2614577 RepID=A0A9P8CTJ4_9HYPO|nr:uncharacterized protein F5Z01DRAFT_632540 [Emericellopsis atlantica]KAG9258462.1 hypothetical protein F5Z01DRAFT_632540 [Emericellopsis atlantica]